MLEAALAAKMPLYVLYPHASAIPVSEAAARHAAAAAGTQHAASGSAVREAAVAAGAGAAGLMSDSGPSTSGRGDNGAVIDSVTQTPGDPKYVLFVVDATWRQSREMMQSVSGQCQGAVTASVTA